MHCNCNGDRQHVRRPSGGGGGGGGGDRGAGGAGGGIMLVSTANQNAPQYATAGDEEAMYEEPDSNA